jgi:hypothetical protein
LAQDSTGKNYAIKKLLIQDTDQMTDAEREISIMVRYLIDFLFFFFFFFSFSIIVIEVKTKKSFSDVFAPSSKYRSCI